MSNLELESITTFFLSLFTKIIVVVFVDVVDVVDCPALFGAFSSTNHQLRNAC